MPPQDPETARWLAEQVQPREPMLRAWLHSRFPQLTDADDIVQDAYARLIAARAKREVRLPKAFFFATARNLALDFFRHRRITHAEPLGGWDELCVLKADEDVSDFFGSVTTIATAEELEKHGLSDDYVGYNLVSQFNVGDARVTGVEYAWRQRLEFLPNWARGVGVFFNGTEMQLSGATTADFSGFTDRTINWGVSLDRPRFSTKLNWNYTGPRRQTAIVGANVPAGTYTYLKSRLQIDVNVEWRLSRRLGVYGTVRNLTNMSNVTEAYAPNTPAYARTRQIDLFGAAYTFGLKGSF